MSLSIHFLACEPVRIADMGLCFSSLVSPHQPPIPLIIRAADERPSRGQHTKHFILSFPTPRHIVSQVSGGFL
jgi:hypothetical protein